MNGSPVTELALDVDCSDANDALPVDGVAADPPMIIFDNGDRIVGVPKEPYWSQFLYAMVAHEDGGSDVSTDV